MIGYCGIVNNDFRFGLIPEQRGKGLGKLIVQKYKSKLKGLDVYVHKDNKASIRCFESNNFMFTGKSGEFLIFKNI